MRCPTCRESELQDGTTQLETTVAEQQFSAQASALVCLKCGESLVDGRVMERFELEVAWKLAFGPPAGESFRFMRKALGLKAETVADLLQTTPETVSRWETGKIRTDAKAFALMAMMILDRRRGRGWKTTQNYLAELANPGSQRQGQVDLGHVA